MKHQTLGQALIHALLFGPPRDTSGDCTSCGSVDAAEYHDPCCIQEHLRRANKAKKEKPCTKE